MPIIEGEYVMSSTARELEQEAFELRVKLWNAHTDLERTQQRELEANARADTYAQLTAVLAIVALLLCVALALAT